jgi:hypothetical protein
MSKWNAIDVRPRNHHSSESGSYSKAPDSLCSSASARNSEHEVSSVMGVPSDVWRRVAWWVAELPEDDPRRRLLELAALRRDVRLAETVLRHL